MDKLIAASTLTALMLTLPNLRPLPPGFDNPQTLGVQAANSQLPVLQPLHTASRFATKLETSSQKIEREIAYQDNPDLELGQEQILDEGKDGVKTTVFRVTYFDGAQYQRETVSVDVKPPENKRIMRGTKIVWRTLPTPDGEVRYWRKLRVWATHYDSRCPGCDDTTATGMKAGKGVIAVDPKLIRLGSRVYVPGYGLAVAGDTGGAVRGKVIDLGFDDARTAGWQARYVDIYLLGPPT